MLLYILFSLCLVLRMFTLWYSMFALYYFHAMAALWVSPDTIKTDWLWALFTGHVSVVYSSVVCSRVDVSPVRSYERSGRIRQRQRTRSVKVMNAGTERDQTVRVHLARQHMAKRNNGRNRMSKQVQRKCNTVWQITNNSILMMKLKVLKPSFVLFDTRALWRPGLSVRVSGC